MNEVIQKLYQRIPNFTKYLFTAGVLVALAMLFPANTPFKYRFSVGQAWLYDDLVAHTDFAIKKTAAEIAEDKNTVEREFSPFFEIDLDILKEKKKAFYKAFEEQLKRNKAQFTDVARNTEGYINYGNLVLEKLYNKGILKPDTAIQNKEKDYVINVLRGNTAEKHTLNNILTLEKAQEWLSDSLPYSRLKEPEFLYDLLYTQLTHNLIYNAEKTKEFRQEELDKISTSRGMVKSGDLIVPKGGIVTQSVYQKLLSYKEYYEADRLTSTKYIVLMIGYVLLTALCLTLFLFYLKLNMPAVFSQLRWLIFLYGWLLMYAFLVYGVKASDVMSPYIIPFGIAPIVIKSFYNKELALITHLLTILIVGLIFSLGFDFVFLQLLVGLIIVYANWDTRYWGNFFNTIFIIILIYSLGYVGISMITSSSIADIDWSVIIWVCLNGFLTLLAYPMIPLLGGFFGFTSSIKLAELSDLNHPLLKELSLKAPGTLQHSLQVANLSEAAAKAIGADDLLVKVAALYHDIGKTLKPLYFIENLPAYGHSGANPHDALPRLESARIIIEHVTEGVRMAEKNNLPKVIINFITAHHGTTLVEYFYRNHLKENNNGEKDRTLFQYPGPKPKTKEETILMLADSLEATSKILKTPDNQSIDELVERIVNDKIGQGQLTESALTFDNLETCKASFKLTLKNIHHVRIEYPNK
jgi:cyclic-di-AMP phosphodiesterase PgpH